ncbi:MULTISPECIES: MATE family efflux transporter [Allobacillus]|uniref:Multidrug export protein MepA n=1 Tax=Allobacillus halotolerans TaxID=570278 RepID=A0ABS6GNT0_9BACI|nr:MULTISPECIES: MATE family efflux transporter [Allobacillus]MBU6080772.1 MATE family efflux transporter [Allobacillus halotolerans]TSJ65779.1 MATE family efflux transporter [Allobacillus sp. SKP2-8]
MEPKQQTEQLGTEKISTLLRNLSVPALIGMFVMTLYNVVDTVFISYGVGIEAVAGTTVAFPMMMIMLAVAAALGVGGSSVISRRLGAQKPEEANLIFGNIITLILLVSVAGILIALFTLEPLLVLFGATPSTIGYAMDYMFPILLGTFFFASGFAANNLVRAEGNARFAMVLMIIPAAINIALDPIFIFGLNMGVQGAAIATVISQAAVFGMIFNYYARGKSSLKFFFENMKLKSAIVKETLSVGMPAFIQQSAGSILVIAVNAMLIEYGTEFYVGIYGIIQRIVMIMALPIMAVMQGMMPIVGYNYGAQNYDRMRETIWLTLKVVTISATSITIILLAIPGPFLRIFTANPEVIEEGSTAMRILFAVFFVVGVQIVAGGLYQALGKPKQALILSLSRQLLILIPLVLILPPYFGVIGVWLAFPISDLLAVVLAVYLLYRDRAPMLVKGKDEDSEKKNVPVMS